MQDGALQRNIRRVFLHGLQTPLLLSQNRTVEAVHPLHLFLSVYVISFPDVSSRSIAPPLPRFISREHFIQKAKDDPFGPWESLHTVQVRHTITFLQT